MMILLTAFAQQAPVDARRVAIVISDELPPYEAPVDAFIDALGVRPRVIQLQGRQVVAEVETQALRGSSPDVVFALGAKAAWAVRQNLPSTPMIYASVQDPARYGIPGEQVTGIDAVVPAETFLSQVTAFFPEVKSVGVIQREGDDAQGLKAAAQDLGLELEVRAVSDPAGFRKAIYSMARDADAVWIRPGRSYLTPAGHRSAVQELRRRGKPLLADSVNMVSAGAAFAVVPNLEGVGRQAASLARRVLEGAAPSILPVESPMELSTAVNLQTLRDGEIPHEKLMLDFADITVQ